MAVPSLLVRWSGPAKSAPNADAPKTQPRIKIENNRGRKTARGGKERSSLWRGQSSASGQQRNCGSLTTLPCHLACALLLHQDVFAVLRSFLLGFSPFFGSLPASFFSPFSSSFFLPLTLIRIVGVSCISAFAQLAVSPAAVPIPVATHSCDFSSRIRVERCRN